MNSAVIICSPIPTPNTFFSKRGSEDPYATPLAHLVATLACLGYLDQARSRVNEALSAARRLNHAQTLSYSLLFANWVGSITRSPGMERHAEELQALSTEHGSSLNLGKATAYRGWSLTMLGKHRKDSRCSRRG
jgi:hypothetical protein